MNIARGVFDHADRAVRYLENGVNLVAGSLIFLLMLLGVCQIVLRTLFQSPVFGYIDIVEVLMVGFAVLPIAYMQRTGGHIRMELLLKSLRGRALWLAELFGTLSAVFIVAVLIPYSFDHFERAFKFGDSTIDIELAIWPAKLVIPVALSILLLRLLIQMAGYARLVAWPGAKPLWVPSLQDHSRRAEEEIRRSADTGPNAERPIK